MNRSPWRLEEVDGSPWRLEEVDGSPWRLEEVDGSPWRLEEVDGSPWRLEEVDGSPWRLEEVDGGDEQYPVESRFAGEMSFFMKVGSKFLAHSGVTKARAPAMLGLTVGVPSWGFSSSRRPPTNLGRTASCPHGYQSHTGLLPVYLTPCPSHADRAPELRRPSPASQVNAAVVAAVPTARQLLAMYSAVPDLVQMPSQWIWAFTADLRAFGI
ncbi:hypothetical protein TRIUR3_28824 [Triticum urartu]|uniref:Uncharacterized protein n=1 Tax=Triticum urartu TaxID=4572 RepID=M7ZSX6_TRIUA|nr:hypothetical protein TRIUR3_28824 [Triticum urartu]